VRLRLGRRYRRRGLGGIIHRYLQDEKYSQRGQYIDDNGYARYTDTNIPVHRHVAEKYILGRKLLPGEDVHHKNRNKLDNRIQNLQVMNHHEHFQKHLIHKIFTGRR